jgi:hypothetical protein
MSVTHRGALVALCLTVSVVTAACQKSATQTSSNSGTEGTGSAPAQAVQVSHIDLGKSIGNDNVVTDKTDAFRPNETVYASVFTSGSSPSAELKTRFTFQDGQVVDETTRTIAPTGQAVTEFHISKPDGFPVGKYRVEVFVNGAPAATKEFEVKNT